ncbi:MAG: UDP-galactopyranose mutase, partial [Clostridia bacterium]|nr:UDP-galactopyranose mutase [Clostridia bacterium]
GANGAGKSTLLKLICGILSPYKGTVRHSGSIAPLIELGAGFDTNLTAGENIYLNGALLGHSKECMEEYYRQIVDFAELHKFMDMPIKNYSSGMRARLGFAIATMVRPSILVVDEVLAVGDAAFQKKCMERMQEMLSGGTTLLFVSHSLPSVRQLCTHAMWLDHGKTRLSGRVDEVCGEYEAFIKPAAGAVRVSNTAPKTKTDENKPEYDYLIVGSGISGATFAYEMARRGKKVLVLEKRDHIGGNVYTEDVEGINVHKYGPHIFHTADDSVWKYMNDLGEFRNFINSPIANYKGELYNLPFNMNTFVRMWGHCTPQQAMEIIESQKGEFTGEAENLEQQAISMVGRDIYEKLIKGYTEKQWGRSCAELPPEIIRRLPVRYTFDNNYFNHPHQGIPAEGYTPIIQRMLDNCEVRLNTDYLSDKETFDALASKVIYTGPIDAYFNYSMGPLAYRSLRFEEVIYPEKNHQGVAVMNYTDAETPYTRAIEHKHFLKGEQPTTVVTYEYPQLYEEGAERYYPINDAANSELYGKYAQLAAKETKTLFLGRLARYTYMDMDRAVLEALKAARAEI